LDSNPVFNRFNAGALERLKSTPLPMKSFNTVEVGKKGLPMTKSGGDGMPIVKQLLPNGVVSYSDKLRTAGDIATPRTGSNNSTTQSRLLAQQGNAPVLTESQWQAQQQPDVITPQDQLRRQQGLPVTSQGLDSSGDAGLADPDALSSPKISPKNHIKSAKPVATQEREQYHPAIASMASELNNESGKLVTDNNGNLTRLPSTNPDWFKGGFAVHNPKTGELYTGHTSVTEIRQAVADHQNNLPLKDKQRAILRALSDIAIDEENANSITDTTAETVKQAAIDSIANTIKEKGSIHDDSQKKARDFIENYGEDSFKNELVPLLKKSGLLLPAPQEKWHYSHHGSPYGGDGVSSRTAYYSQDNEKGIVVVQAYFNNKDDAESGNIDKAKHFVIKGHYADIYFIKNVTESQLDSIANDISKFRSDNPQSSSNEEHDFIEKLGFSKDRYGHRYSFDGNQQEHKPAQESTSQTSQDLNSNDTSYDKYDDSIPFRKSMAGETKPSGLSIGEVERIANDFMDYYNGNIPLSLLVRNTQEQLYGKNATIENKGIIKGAYHSTQRLVTLAASNLSGELDTIETLRHEVLGHYGLNLFAPSDKADILATIARSKSNPFIAQEFKSVQKKYPELANDEFKQAEEVFAKIAEQQPKQLQALIDRIVSKIAQLLRKIGLLRGTTTKAELRNLTRSIAKGIRNGQRTQQTFPTSDEVQFHKVWHGSPHDHNKFDSAKIGTGEGAQVFGYGHYFTDEKAIGEHYRKTLSVKRPFFTIDNINYSYNPMDGKYYAFNKGTGESKKIAKKLFEEKQAIDSKGKLYEAELAPTQDEYLDWDKQLSAQSETVKNAIREANRKDMKKVFKNTLLDSAMYNEDGNQFYNKMLPAFSSPKELSAYLRSIGIRGIRYKADQGKTDANNYVIFDDNDIQIIAKYSLKNGETPEKPHSKTSLSTALRTQLDKAFGQGWFNRLMATGKFVIISKAEAKALGANPNSQAFYSPESSETGLKKDTTYFVADNIDTRTNLVKLALHEIGTHALQLGKDSATFKAILQQVKNLTEQRRPSEAVRAAIKAAKDAKTPDDLFLEEVAAYLVEFHPDLNVSQKIIAWFKAQLRRMGIHTAMNESDIVSMARAALSNAPTDLLFDGDVRGELRNSKGQLLAPNGRPSNLNAMQYAQVRTPEFKAWFGDWEAVENIKWLDTGKPVATMQGDEVPLLGGIANIADWVANNWLEKNNGVVYREDMGDITIDKKAVRTSAGHGLNRFKVQAFYLVPDVIKNGRLLGQLPIQEGKPVAELIAAPVKIGDSTFKMYVEVRHDANMKKMYVHEVVLREDSSTPAFKISAASHKEAEPQSAKRGALFSFIQNLRNVNASKVVDENGEPLVVYHGTKSDFSVFSLNKLKNNLKGTGIYTSDNAKIASGYADSDGNVMPLFLNMKNPYTEYESEIDDDVYDSISNADPDEAIALYQNAGFDGVWDKTWEVLLSFNPN
jgi:hypothetical protein